MRVRAPWMNFVPTVYYDEDNVWVGYQWPDLFLTLDSILFYFRGERLITGAANNPCNDAGCDFDVSECEYRCLARPLPGSSAACAEATIPDAPTEVDRMASLLAPGRKLQVGVYFHKHSTCGDPTLAYDLELSQTLLARPEVGGRV